MGMRRGHQLLMAILTPYFLSMWHFLLHDAILVCITDIMNPIFCLECEHQ